MSNLVVVLFLSLVFNIFTTSPVSVCVFGFFSYALVFLFCFVYSLLEVPLLPLVAALHRVAPLTHSCFPDHMHLHYSPKKESHKEFLNNMEALRATYVVTFPLGLDISASARPLLLGESSHVQSVDSYIECSGCGFLQPKGVPTSVSLCSALHPSQMYRCLNVSCEGVIVCQFCHLMGVSRSCAADDGSDGVPTQHDRSHRTESLIPQSVMEARHVWNPQVWHPLELLSSSVLFNPVEMTVMFSLLAPASSPSPSQYAHPNFLRYSNGKRVVFDLCHMQCVALLSTHGVESHCDSLSFDSSSSLIIGFSGHRLSIERWVDVYSVEETNSSPSEASRNDSVKVRRGVKPSITTTTATEEQLRRLRMSADDKKFPRPEKQVGCLKMVKRICDQLHAFQGAETVSVLTNSAILCIDAVEAAIRMWRYSTSPVSDVLEWSSVVTSLLMLTSSFTRKLALVRYSARRECTEFVQRLRALVTFIEDSILNEEEDEGEEIDVDEVIEIVDHQDGAPPRKSEGKVVAVLRRLRSKSKTSSSPPPLYTSTSVSGSSQNQESSSRSGKKGKPMKQHSRSSSMGAKPLPTTTKKHIFVSQEMTRALSQLVSEGFELLYPKWSDRLTTFYQYTRHWSASVASPYSAGASSNSSYSSRSRSRDDTELGSLGSRTDPASASVAMGDSMAAMVYTKYIIEAIGRKYQHIFAGIRPAVPLALQYHPSTSQNGGSKQQNTPHRTQEPNEMEKKEVERKETEQKDDNPTFTSGSGGNHDHVNPAAPVPVVDLTPSNDELEEVESMVRDILGTSQSAAMDLLSDVIRSDVIKPGAVHDGIHLLLCFVSQMDFASHHVQLLESKDEQSQHISSYVQCLHTVFLHGCTVLEQARLLRVGPSSVKNCALTGSLGKLLPWAVAWMNDLVGSPRWQLLSHASFSDILSSTMQLVCKLRQFTTYPATHASTASLYDLASSVYGSLTSNLSTPYSSIYNFHPRGNELGSGRHTIQQLAAVPMSFKIAALRARKLLVTHIPTGLASIGNNSDLAGASKLKPQLLPLARDIFSIIFFEFANYRVWKGRDLPVMTMSKDDFGRYLAAVQSPSRAEKDIDRVFNCGRYCKSLDGEPKYLTLRRFLSYNRDAAVDRPEVVLDELRVLQYGYEFWSDMNGVNKSVSSLGGVRFVPEGEHNSLRVLMDAKVGFGLMLGHIFPVHGKADDENVSLPLSSSLFSMFATPSDDISMAAAAAAASRAQNVQHGGSGGGAPLRSPVSGKRKGSISSSSPGTTGSTGGGGGSRGSDRSHESEVTVLKLIESHEIWKQHPDHMLQHSFLTEFAHADVLALPQLRRNKSSAQDVSVSDRLYHHQCSAAAKFSCLFRHCLSELGGGRDFDLSFASACENSFAAAYLKHNDLVHTCLMFSTSIDILVLLRKVDTVGVRAMFHPDTPQWLKRAVHVTFQFIRTPILRELRSIAERESEPSSQEQKLSQENPSDEKNGWDGSDDGFLPTLQGPRIPRCVADMVDAWCLNARFLLSDFSLEVENSKPAISRSGTPLRSRRSLRPDRQPYRTGSKLHDKNRSRGESDDALAAVRGLTSDQFFSNDFDDNEEHDDFIDSSGDEDGPHHHGQGGSGGLQLKRVLSDTRDSPRSRRGSPMLRSSESKESWVSGKPRSLASSMTMESLLLADQMDNSHEPASGSTGTQGHRSGAMGGVSGSGTGSTAHSISESVRRRPIAVKWIVDLVHSKAPLDKSQLRSAITKVRSAASLRVQLLEAINEYTQGPMSMSGALSGARPSPPPVSATSALFSPISPASSPPKMTRKSRGEKASAGVSTHPSSVISPSLSKAAVKSSATSKIQSSSSTSRHPLRSRSWQSLHEVYPPVLHGDEESDPLVVPLRVISHKDSVIVGIIDEIFPVLWQHLRGSHRTHLVSQIHTGVRSSRGDDAMLFYLKSTGKRLQEMLESPSTSSSTSGSSASGLNSRASASTPTTPTPQQAWPWQRIRNILQFLSCDFLSQDRDMLLASGILGSLLRFMERLDEIEEIYQQALSEKGGGLLRSPSDRQATEEDHSRMEQKAQIDQLSNPQAESIAFVDSPIDPAMGARGDSQKSVLYEKAYVEGEVKMVIRCKRSAWQCFLYLTMLCLSQHVDAELVNEGQGSSNGTAAGGQTGGNPSGDTGNSSSYPMGRSSNGHQRVVLASMIGTKLVAMLRRNMLKLREIELFWPLYETVHVAASHSPSMATIPTLSSDRLGGPKRDSQNAVPTEEAADSSFSGLVADGGGEEVNAGHSPSSAGATESSQHLEGEDSANGSGRGSEAVLKVSVQLNCEQRDELVYQTVDILRILQQVTVENRVCTPEDVVFLVESLLISNHPDGAHGRPVRPSSSSDQSSSTVKPLGLPSIVEIDILRMLRHEIIHHPPSTFEPNNISDMLLQYVGCLMPEVDYLRKQEKLERSGKPKSTPAAPPSAFDFESKQSVGGGGGGGGGAGSTGRRSTKSAPASTSASTPHVRVPSSSGIALDESESWGYQSWVRTWEGRQRALSEAVALIRRVCIAQNPQDSGKAGAASADELKTEEDSASQVVIDSHPPANAWHNAFIDACRKYINAIPNIFKALVVKNIVLTYDEEHRDLHDWTEEPYSQLFSPKHRFASTKKKGAAFSFGDEEPSDDEASMLTNFKRILRFSKFPGLEAMLPGVFATLSVFGGMIEPLRRGSLVEVRVDSPKSPSSLATALSVASSSATELEGSGIFHDSETYNLQEPSFRGIVQSLGPMEKTVFVRLQRDVGKVHELLPFSTSQVTPIPEVPAVPLTALGSITNTLGKPQGVLSTMLKALDGPRASHDNIYALISHRLVGAIMRTVATHITHTPIERGAVDSCREVVTRLMTECGRQQEALRMSHSQLVRSSTMIRRVMSEYSLVSDDGGRSASSSVDMLVRIHPPQFSSDHESVNKKMTENPLFKQYDKAKHAESKSEDLSQFPRPGLIGALQAITAMGYSETLSKFALCSTHGDVNEAMNYILSERAATHSLNPGEVENEWNSLLRRMGIRRDVAEYYLREWSSSGSDAAEEKTSSSPTTLNFDDRSCGSTAFSGEQFRSTKNMERETEKIIPSAATVGMDVYINHEAAGMFTWSEDGTDREYSGAAGTESSTNDEPIPAKRKRAPSHKHDQKTARRRMIKPGYVIRMLDTYKLVNKAIVLSVKGERIRVHYVGWDAKWEEIISIYSERILEVLGPLAPPQGEYFSTHIYCPFNITSRTGVIRKLACVSKSGSVQVLSGGDGSATTLSLPSATANSSRDHAQSLPPSRPRLHADSKSGVDASFEEDTSPAVEPTHALVEITDGELTCTIFVWVKLSSLRSVAWRSCASLPRKYLWELPFGSLLKLAVQTEVNLNAEFAAGALSTLLFRSRCLNDSSMVPSSNSSSQVHSSTVLSSPTVLGGGTGGAVGGRRGDTFRSKLMSPKSYLSASGSGSCCDVPGSIVCHLTCSMYRWVNEPPKSSPSRTPLLPLSSIISTLPFINGCVDNIPSLARSPSPAIRNLVASHIVSSVLSFSSRPSVSSGSGLSSSSSLSSYYSGAPSSTGMGASSTSASDTSAPFITSSGRPRRKLVVRPSSWRQLLEQVSDVLQSQLRLFMGQCSSFAVERVQVLSGRCYTVFVGRGGEKSLLHVVAERGWKGGSVVELYSDPHCKVPVAQISHTETAPAQIVCPNPVYVVCRDTVHTPSQSTSTQSLVGFLTFAPLTYESVEALSFTVELLTLMKNYLSADSVVDVRTHCDLASLVDHRLRTIVVEVSQGLLRLDQHCMYPSNFKARSLSIISRAALALARPLVGLSTFAVPGPMNEKMLSWMKGLARLLDPVVDALLVEGAHMVNRALSNKTVSPDAYMRRAFEFVVALLLLLEHMDAHGKAVRDDGTNVYHLYLDKAKRAAPVVIVVMHAIQFAQTTAAQTLYNDVDGSGGVIETPPAAGAPPVAPAGTPSSSSSQESPHCSCSVCSTLTANPSLALHAMLILDLTPSSLWHEILRFAARRQLSMVNTSTFTPSPTSPTPTTSSSHSSATKASIATSAIASTSLVGDADSPLRSSTPHDIISSSSPLVSPPSSGTERHSMTGRFVAGSSLIPANLHSLSYQILVGRNVRLAALNAMLQSTASSGRQLPEISFTRPSDAKTDGERDYSMFNQLVDSFNEIPVWKLRGAVGKVTWHTRFRGALHTGAAGLAGPFRQSLSEICASIRQSVIEDPQNALFLQCPNGVHQAGEDRNKLIINPFCTSPTQLNSYFVFGQLMGIAIRSESCLDLDLASVFWKTLLHGWEAVYEDELNGKQWLASFDYNAWRFLKFTDPVTGKDILEDEFESYELRYVMPLSDGRTEVEVKPGGRSIPVRYKDRFVYARLAKKTRFLESHLQYSAVRAGLTSVVHSHANCLTNALRFVIPEELELKVCGESTLDLAVLKEHTMYKPSSFNEDHPLIRNFWQVLEEFSEDVGVVLPMCV